MRRNQLRTAVGTTLIASLLTLGGPASPSAAAETMMPGFDGACEGELLELHNQARAAEDLPPLREDYRFNQVTRAWAMELSKSRSLRHNPNYVPQISKMVNDWERMGENVGYGPNAEALNTAYLNSPGHRANILSTHFERVAIGCFRDANGRAWTSVNFVEAKTVVPNRSYAPFMSSGEAVGQLRKWLMGNIPPVPGVVEADTDRLLAGQVDVPTYAGDLVSSTAHSGKVPPTTRLYYAVFLRDPDVDGLRFWIGQAQGGLSLQTMANRFVASREFQARYGELTDPQYVDRVYTNILGRPADAEGRAFWTQKMREGWSRGRVLVGFSESAEYKRKTDVDVTVSWVAIQMLGRPATELERTTWGTQLRTGLTTPRSLVMSLVRSNDVAQRADARA